MTDSLIHAPDQMAKSDEDGSIANDCFDLCASCSSQSEKPFQELPASLPGPRKLERRIGNGRVAAKALLKSCEEHYDQNFSAYKSHRRYVHSMVMSEIDSCITECREEEWNSLDCIFFSDSPRQLQECLNE